MKTRHIIIIAIASLCPVLFGWTPTNFVYFTNVERQRDGSRVAMIGGDGIVGRVRSNDTLLFLGGALYTSSYYSAQDTYLVSGNGQPNFQWEPRLGQDSLRIGNAEGIRGNANPFISDRNGQWMTWIKLKGDAGIDIFQYPLGGQRNDSLYANLGVPGWQTIFVDGQCEVEGTLTGGLVIGSAQNMWLLDDVRYSQANPRTGEFDESNRSIGMLTLYSEQNIIIKNTFRNGRENGIAYANDWNRHSIVITAAVITPNGSFTFEHQNNDWEPYQGPEPDERGYVWLKGCLIQNQRGILHTSNHNGTGYGLSLRYDRRFESEPPFGFDDDNVYWIDGDINHLELDTTRNYIFGRAVIRDLTILPEHKIFFYSGSRLEVRRSLNLLGREDRSVHLQVVPEQIAAGELIFSGRGMNSVRIVHADLDSGLNVTLDSDSISIHSSVINGSLDLSGTFELANSEVEGKLLLDRPGRGKITRCLLLEGMEVDNWGWDLEVLNNTIMGTSADAIRLESGFNTNIRNNIITSSRNGIVCDGIEPPQVGFNLLYDIQRQAYFGCEPGEGALSADPQFVDPRRGDYHLQENSPCIDAGDPASPLDPDGTRADVGAFWFDRDLEVDDDDDDDDFPPCLQWGNTRGGISASPNPFNSSTLISFQSAKVAKSAVRFAIYDLSGRVIFQNPNSIFPVVWDASAFPAGIYLARAEAVGKVSIMKLMLVR